MSTKMSRTYLLKPPSAKGDEQISESFKKRKGVFWNQFSWCFQVQKQQKKKPRIQVMLSWNGPTH